MVLWTVYLKILCEKTLNFEKMYELHDTANKRRYLCDFGLTFSVCAFFSNVFLALWKNKLFHYSNKIIKMCLKGHSYENVCEIIALNDRLDPN
jgi:hypothetical protein